MKSKVTLPLPPSSLSTALTCPTTVPSLEYSETVKFVLLVVNSGSLSLASSTITSTSHSDVLVGLPESEATTVKFSKDFDSLSSACERLNFPGRRAN